MSKAGRWLIVVTKREVGKTTLIQAPGRCQLRSRRLSGRRISQKDQVSRDTVIRVSLIGFREIGMGVLCSSKCLFRTGFRDFWPRRVRAYELKSYRWLNRYVHYFVRLDPGCRV